MKYGSVCSGIEAATVAWHPIGWEAQWFSEIERFPCKVLAHHYPQVPNLGDMTKLLENEKFQKSTIDVLVGGTPCQSFSIAGLRGGLADQRGNLALEYCRLLIAKRPAWFVWENVPGVFSSFSDDKESKVSYCPEADAPTIGGYDCTQTADFATLLMAFQECGYSVSYRVFDSQYFGVPQRRRRVFVVGHLGNDWRPPFAVLFDKESLRRDITPIREEGQRTTGNLTKSAYADSLSREDKLIIWPAEVSATLDKTLGTKQGYQNQHIFQGASHFVPYRSFQAKAGAGAGIAESDQTPTLDTTKVPAVYSIMPMNSGKDYKAREVAVTQPLCAGGPVGGNQGGDFIVDSIVRRLTPTECARLQGFPDDYLQSVPGYSDSQAYAAFGNSMTTWVMQHIGKRIQKVSNLLTINH